MAAMPLFFGSLGISYKPPIKTSIQNYYLFHILSGFSTAGIGNRRSERTTVLYHKQTRMRCISRIAAEIPIKHLRTPTSELKWSLNGHLYSDSKPCVRRT